MSTWSCRSGGAVDINRNTSQLWAHQQSSTASCCQGILKFSNFYRTQVWSLPCLVIQSVTHWPCWILFNFLDLSKKLHEFIVVTWTFEKIDTWIPNWLFFLLLYVQNMLWTPVLASWILALIQEFVFKVYKIIPHVFFHSFSNKFYTTQCA